SVTRRTSHESCAGSRRSGRKLCLHPTRTGHVAGAVQVMVARTTRCHRPRNGTERVKSPAFWLDDPRRPTGALGDEMRSLLKKIRQMRGITRAVTGGLM